MFLKQTTSTIIKACRFQNSRTFPQKTTGSIGPLGYRCTNQLPIHGGPEVHPGRLYDAGLIVGRVGPYTGKGKPFTLVRSQMGPARGFAVGLDVMSVLGSGLAEGIIKAQSDHEYDGYLQKVDSLRRM